MPPTYRVITSGVVRAQFRSIGRWAIYAGRGEEVTRAMRQLHQLLEHAPLGVGDPMYRLRRAKLRIRHLIVSPLYVEYGVHETEPVVHIRSVASLRGPAGPV